MSKGPTGTKEFKSTAVYYNLQLSKKDWCTYFKTCPMNYNVPGSYCWACKHRREVDVPHLLAERGRCNNENNIRSTVSNTK